MAGVGGSAFVVSEPDWVLVELPMPEMRSPRARFSAYLEAPTDALSGVLPADWLPIQGIAYDQGGRAEYDVNPCLAFPWYDEPTHPAVFQEKRIFSLLVDLRGFGAAEIVQIGLYGFIETYNLTGQVTDGPFFGTVESSEFYGSVNLDTSTSADPQTPAQWTALQPENTVHMAVGKSHDTLISVFPELTPLGSVVGGFGGGQVNAFFAWDHIGIVWVGDPGLVSPDSDPSAFMISTAAADINTYWAPGILKTNRTVGMTAQYAMPAPIPIATNVVTTPPVPPDNGQSVTVAYRDIKGYFVPTTLFSNDRNVPVNVAATQGANIWTGQGETRTPRPDYSLTWETGDYPDRPEMAEIGTAVVPAIPFVGPASDDYTLPNHLGQQRIGTITIFRSTGEVVFEPPEAPPPPDGTPGGTGPIGDGTAPGRTANPQLRAWTFSHDGHDFYVLRLGDFDQLVYDTYSEQWMDWNDFNSLTWRAHCGINWSGAEALAETYGSNIVAGDDAYGLLWFLDPEQPYDDAPIGGGAATYFSRVTMGQVPKNGREVLPCYATWLTTDMGDPAYSGAAVTLWTSDDAGVTWDNHGYVSVTAGAASPELSWYSLGQIGAPGRLFRIFDDGAITRIDALEMNDPDDEK